MLRILIQLVRRFWSLDIFQYLKDFRQGFIGMGSVCSCIILLDAHFGHYILAGFTLAIAFGKILVAGLGGGIGKALVAKYFEDDNKNKNDGQRKNSNKKRAA